MDLHLFLCITDFDLSEKMVEENNVRCLISEIYQSKHLNQLLWSIEIFVYYKIKKKRLI